MAITGLAGFKAEKKRREEAAEERNKPKAEYFNWKNNQNKEDKNIAYVRFLQEMDKDVDTYNEDRGLPIMQIEHTAPGKEGYKRRANCTLESEGRCFACERHTEDKATAPVDAEGKKKLKGWGQKSNLYIWALVDYKDGEGARPVVISRPFGSSFVEDLIEAVEEDDNNRLTDKMFKIVKSGTGFDTKWKLRVAKGVELLDDTEVEVLPLEDAVLRKIPYEEQPGYFGAVYRDGDPTDDDLGPQGETLPPKTERTESGPLTW